MSMQSTDPIADLLTRIRNAIMVRKNEVRVPASRLKKAIAETLVQNNYLHSVKLEEGSPRGTLVVTINEPGANSVITEISKVSKPGRRVYVRANEIPRVKNGRGIVLLSTSKGIMTGHEAKKQHLGGELLVEVY